MLHSSYGAEGWEKVVEERQDLLHSSDGGSAAAVAGLGNLITPEALADMCRFEESVTSFAAADDNGGYCARRKRDGGECCLMLCCLDHKPKGHRLRSPYAWESRGGHMVRV
jgi:hypothetical protein